MREGVRGKKSKTFLLFRPLTSSLRFPKDGSTLLNEGPGTALNALLIGGK